MNTNGFVQNVTQPIWALAFVKHVGGPFLTIMGKFPKTLFLFIFLWSICLHAVEQESINTQKILSSIPKKEQQYLEDFFKSLFVQGAFAYTLFGPKPMAITSYNLNYSFQLSSSNYRKLLIASLRGLDIWKKYCHLFPMKRFCFLIPEKIDQTFDFILLDKDKCLACINKNRANFDPKITSKDILEKLCKKQILFNDHKNISYHRRLGILLGYPIECVEAFCKNIETKENKVFHLIKASIETHSLFPITIPGFMSRKMTLEIIEMQCHYDEIKQKLVQIYLSDNFLELIISELMK